MSYAGGQLGFTPGLGAGFAGAPAADEFGHEAAGGLIAHFPVAGQDGFSSGDSAGASQDITMASGELISSGSTGT